LSDDVEDYGLGTAYERGAVYARLGTWLGSACAGQRIVEGPDDGFAGMPGLHALGLARLGAFVTVVHESAERLADVRAVYASADLSHQLTTRQSAVVPDGQWDAAISFNAQATAGDWQTHLRALASRARRLVVFVTHPFSYGTLLRRALRRLEPVRTAELFDHPATRARILLPLLEKFGTVEDRAWVDCPWWPDLFVPQGSGLLDGTLSRFFPGARRTQASAFRYGPGDFPWATDDRPAALLLRMRRHPSFENLPWISPIFAHHRAYLVHTTANTRAS
jgi:hypothetical protein